MARVEKSATVDPDVLADLEAACNAKGIIRVGELYRWITDRADRGRQETRKKFGDQEIGAEIIRRIHDQRDSSSTHRRLSFPVGSSRARLRQGDPAEG